MAKPAGNAIRPLLKLPVNSAREPLTRGEQIARLGLFAPGFEQKRLPRVVKGRGHWFLGDLGLCRLGSTVSFFQRWGKAGFVCSLTIWLLVRVAS